MKGAALPRLSTALRAVLHSLRSLRPLRGDRLRLLVLTKVEADWQAIILFPLREAVGRQGRPPEMRMGLSLLTPTREAHPMERVLELLGPAVQFAYTCWDRIVLHGYLERLQRPENLIYFFHDVVGIACIEPAVLQQRTNAYKAWVRRVTDEWDIPVLQAPPAPPRGERKEHFVVPFYRRLKGGEGIACVLTSMEQGRTFVSYAPRFRPPSGDANYRFIKACRKQFLHYYWHALDPVMGPMPVRVSTSFPFTVP